MPDIRLNWDTDNYRGDLLVEGNDLALDSGLETAVLISLFTDRRAKVDDALPDPSSTDRQGWFGDLILPIEEGDQIGSRLWLLRRSKNLPINRNKAKKYIEEALQWMIKDGIAAKIEVEVETIRTSPTYFVLAYKVSIFKPDGKEVPLKFEDEWKAQGEA